MRARHRERGWKSFSPFATGFVILWTLVIRHWSFCSPYPNSATPRLIYRAIAHPKQHILDETLRICRLVPDYAPRISAQEPTGQVDRAVNHAAFAERIHLNSSGRFSQFLLGIRPQLRFGDVVHPFAI